MAPRISRTRLDEILKASVAPPGETVAAGKLLAAGFVVIDQNETLYSGAAGHLRFDPGSEPYTIDSVSWAASMTKLVTTVCLMQLVEKGLVTLDEDAGARVPQLREMQVLTGFDDSGKPILKENTTPITLRHLLTHTTGLAYPPLNPLLQQWANYIGLQPDVSRGDLANYTSPLMFTAGESWVYGTSIDWAGQLLEQVTGQRLSEYMKEHIFEPLGMSSTAFHPRDIPNSEKRMTAVGQRSPTDQTLTNLPFSRVPAETDIDSGGGGLFGTPGDYAKFLQALLRYRLVSQKTTDEMFSPQLKGPPLATLEKFAGSVREVMAPEFEPGTPMNHGLSGLINTQDLPGKRRAGSMQWSGMLNSHWWIDRQAGIAGVLFTSVQPMGDAPVIKVYDALERAVYSELSQSSNL